MYKDEDMRVSISYIIFTWFCYFHILKINQLEIHLGKKENELGWMCFQLKLSFQKVGQYSITENKTNTENKTLFAWCTVL